MELRTDLIKKTEANRARKDISNMSISINEIEELYNAEYNGGSDEIWEIRKKINSIDESIKKGRIIKVNEAQNIRKRLVKQAQNIMVKYGFLDYYFIENENIKLSKMLEKYYEHYFSTLYLEELIQQYDFIQNMILAQAEHGQELQQWYDSKKNKVSKERRRIEAELKALNPRKMLKKISLQDKLKKNEQELQSLKEEFLEGGISYRIETICFNLIYRREYDREQNGYKYIEKDNPLEAELETEIWKLTPSAHEKLTNMIVEVYKMTNKTAIEHYRNERSKESKHAWKISQRKKDLSADEKRELVKMGKEDGYTQKQTAKEINCSTRTVQKYWNN